MEESKKSHRSCRVLVIGRQDSRAFKTKFSFKERQTVKHSGTIKLPSSVLLLLMQANIHYVTEIKTRKSIYCVKFIVIRANRWSWTPKRDTETALPLGRRLMVSFAFLAAFFHMDKLIEPSLLLLCFTYMTVTRPEFKTLNPELSGMSLGGREEKDSKVVAMEEVAHVSVASLIRARQHSLEKPV